MLILKDGKWVKADAQGNVIEVDGKPVEATAEEVAQWLKEHPETKNPSEMSLEELAKLNPELAKAIADAEAIKAQKAIDDAEADEKKRKQAEQDGQWQQLAEDEKKKREQAEADKQKALADATKANELLGKYKGTMGEAVKSLMAQIPDDKKQLIPDTFQDRQRFEYILKNADFLGIKTVIKGAGGVPENDQDPKLDGEGKLQQEFDDLVAKGANRTALETKQMVALSAKLKEIQNRKQAESNK